MSRRRARGRTSALATSLLAAGALLTLSGCFPYIYHDRSQVLIDGIDIDQSIDVAAMELQESETSAVLTLWALRDQHVTPRQAARINDLYFDVAAELDDSFFATWHLTWAISDLYRLGDADVQAALEPAYQDAAVRVRELDRRISTKHFFDEPLTMGDAHALGRAFAHNHLVVPGNEDYLQSAEQLE